jgi:hypothetical protein
MGADMTRLDNPVILAQIREALENAANGVGRYVSWKPIAWEWVLQNLDGETQRSMASHLLEYVREGNKIDQVIERRGFNNSHHYDFRPRINNLDVYVEAVLAVTRTGPSLYVVSTHLK